MVSAQPCGITRITAEVGGIGEQRALQPFRAGSGILSLVVLIATILGMIFEKQTGISGGSMSCIGAGVVVTGVLSGMSL